VPKISPKEYDAQCADKSINTARLVLVFRRGSYQRFLADNGKIVEDNNEIIRKYHRYPIFGHVDGIVFGEVYTKEYLYRFNGHR
jgi:hypothetical protein